MEDKKKKSAKKAVKKVESVAEERSSMNSDWLELHPVKKAKKSSKK